MALFTTSALPVSKLPVVVPLPVSTLWARLINKAAHALPGAAVRAPPASQSNFLAVGGPAPLASFRERSPKLQRRQARLGPEELAERGHVLEPQLVGNFAHGQGSGR